MDKNSVKTTNTESSDLFDIIASTMIEFREEMEQVDALGSKIAAKTRFVITVVFAISLLSSVYLGFMIFQMANHMSKMTVHMEDMYNNFGVMSQDMHAIAISVDSMSKNINGMPVIAESMSRMDNDVRGMNASVFAINKNINAIDNGMVRINVDMREMTGRLSNMNRSVSAMSYDVNEMAAPMNTGPLNGFWPR